MEENKLSITYKIINISKEVQDKIYKELENNNIDDLDVLIATPPCQGMSVANHKKNDNEIKRNSLVVESIKIVKEIL